MEFIHLWLKLVLLYRSKNLFKVIHYIKHSLLNIRLFPQVTLVTFLEKSGKLDPESGTDMRMIRELIMPSGSLYNILILINMNKENKKDQRSQTIDPLIG